MKSPIFCFCLGYSPERDVVGMHKFTSSLAPAFAGHLLVASQAAGVTGLRGSTVDDDESPVHRLIRRNLGRKHVIFTSHFPSYINLVLDLSGVHKEPKQLSEGTRSEKPPEPICNPSVHETAVSHLTGVGLGRRVRASCVGGDRFLTGFGRCCYPCLHQYEKGPYIHIE